MYNFILVLKSLFLLILPNMESPIISVLDASRLCTLGGEALFKILTALLTDTHPVLLTAVALLLLQN